MLAMSSLSVKWLTFILSKRINCTTVAPLRLVCSAFKLTFKTYYWLEGPLLKFLLLPPFDILKRQLARLERWFRSFG
jgi:hypothetical protein